MKTHIYYNPFNHLDITTYGHADLHCNILTSANPVKPSYGRKAAPVSC
jgi:hypothetical protein